MIYLFIYFNRRGLSSHNHKNSKLHIFPGSQIQEHKRNSSLWLTWALWALLSPFPSTWLWCSTSLGSNSGLALCLWLENKTLFFSCAVFHTVGEEGGVFLPLKPYRATTERLLLCVCSSPFSPLLEVVWRVLKLQRPRVEGQDLPVPSSVHRIQSCLFKHSSAQAELLPLDISSHEHLSPLHKGPTKGSIPVRVP